MVVQKGTHQREKARFASPDGFGLYFFSIVNGFILNVKFDYYCVTWVRG